MNVLAVGAHWDDIEIGCALTLRRMKKRGARIYGVVLTDSAYSVPGDGHVREKASAALEGRKVFSMIGVSHKQTSLLPNQTMVYDQRTMQELETIAGDCRIDVVFTHWFGDHNTDHRAAWEMSRTAFRRVGTLLQYQSNSYFDNVSVFQPQYFFGFSGQEYAFKKKIMAMHVSEWRYRRERWQREVFDRERFLGYQCGCDYAEAFMVSRIMDAD